jgi:hypothetical protein
VPASRDARHRDVDALASTELTTPAKSTPNATSAMAASGAPPQGTFVVVEASGEPAHPLTVHVVDAIDAGLEDAVSPLLAAPVARACGWSDGASFVALTIRPGSTRLERIPPPAMVDRRRKR